MGAKAKLWTSASTILLLASIGAAAEPLSTARAVVATAEESATVAASDVLGPAPTPVDRADERLDELKQRRLARVIIRPSTPRARAEIDPGANATVEPATPQRDPTLISVPSNTLGAGEPLWMRRDRESAELRRVQAETAIVEREAARPAPDYYDYGYDDVVVYGPHAPRWALRNWYRPGLHLDHHIHDTGDRGLVKPIYGPGAHATETIEPTDDVLDRAQIEFGRIAYPKIGHIVEPQLEAQRKFGRNATPPIIRIQKQIDDAQLKIRKQAPLPK